MVDVLGSFEPLVLSRPRGAYRYASSIRNWSGVWRCQGAALSKHGWCSKRTCWKDIVWTAWLYGSRLTTLPPRFLGEAWWPGMPGNTIGEDTGEGSRVQSSRLRPKSLRLRYIDPAETASARMWTGNCGVCYRYSSPCVSSSRRRCPAPSRALRRVTAITDGHGAPICDWRSLTRLGRRFRTAALRSHQAL